ncbi:DUF6207 family protein [Streptomyces sp. AC602_WCS936]|uniref:DUF6207 family protein n=1 Tax=Streptomyces sp. AC602_WCS936 TaxID=2823685 RepID=UPI0020B83CA4|nr:DUF6207 family protein [Streptomyces sp. AC602_WCS936]
MEAVNDVHVSEPGLVVVDVAAADDDTAFAFHAVPAAQWVTTSVERTTREAGQAGVRLRCYLDMRLAVFQLASCLPGARRVDEQHATPPR